MRDVKRLEQNYVLGVNQRLNQNLKFTLQHTQMGMLFKSAKVECQDSTDKKGAPHHIVVQKIRSNFFLDRIRISQYICKKYHYEILETTLP
jgi:hypothetical protein